MLEPLQERDFVAAAFSLQCEVQAIKAVCQIEAPRGGFIDGHPVTLFEGHIFHKYTNGRFDAGYPALSYPRWTTVFYGRTAAAEWDRLQRAINLDRTAALMSASWGKFQICGFNFAACGFTSVDAFVAAVSESEQKQLEAFVAYMLHTGLNTALQTLDWATFARRYNGPEYQKNNYDGKLAQAYTNCKIVA